MSPIHVNIPDTLEAKKSRFIEIVNKVVTKIKDTNVEGQIVLAPHIKVNKEVSRDETSATIVVSSIDEPR